MLILLLFNFSFEISPKNLQLNFFEQLLQIFFSFILKNFLKFFVDKIISSENSLNFIIKIIKIKKKIKIFLRD
jgi:hypothetical protein